MPIETAHQIILPENAPSESLYPRPIALQMMKSGPQAELFGLFPELALARSDSQTRNGTYGNVSRDFVARTWLADLIANHT